MDPAVAAFLHELDHPRKKDIETVRRIVLDASPAIGEGIKWNAPSFKTADWFATFHLRSQDCVQLVLHRGAKVKDNSTSGVQIAEPAGLLQWLAKERCLVNLGKGKAIAAKRAALQAILRAWIAAL